MKNGVNNLRKKNFQKELCYSQTKKTNRLFVVRFLKIPDYPIFMVYCNTQHTFDLVFEVGNQKLVFPVETRNQV